MSISPFLKFYDQAEEAFLFYQSIFGGTLHLKRLNTIPGTANLSPSEKNRIAHIRLIIPKEGTLLTGADCLPGTESGLQIGNNNRISFITKSKEKARNLFNDLSQDGEIEVPLNQVLNNIYFGELKDKYGVSWVISTHSKQIVTQKYNESLFQTNHKSRDRGIDQILI